MYHTYACASTYGVRVPRVLRVSDGHLVVARDEEDAAELLLQRREAPRHGHLRVRHVAGDDEHVILKGDVVDPVHPVLVLPVVEVDVGDGERPHGASGPARVDVEARAEAQGVGRGAPEEHLLEAGVPALPRDRVLLVLQLEAPRELGVGLLVEAVAEQRHAELAAARREGGRGGHRLMIIVITIMIIIIII